MPFPVMHPSNPSNTAKLRPFQGLSVCHLRVEMQFVKRFTTYLCVRHLLVVTYKTPRDIPYNPIFFRFFDFSDPDSQGLRRMKDAVHLHVRYLSKNRIKIKISEF